MIVARSLSWLRFLLAVYFALIIGEGVLRKWVFPQYSDAIFLARDPLVLLIYVVAWQTGRLRWLPNLAFLWIVAVLAVVCAFAGETPWMVTLFGLRTNFLHLPLIFVLGATLDREEVRRYGVVCLWLALGIALLMIAQFNAPREAWINVGAGGVQSGQILGALDRVRPPGPFSFIGGVVMFFSLASAFVLCGWVQPGVYRRPLLLIGTFAGAVALPISISRSLVFNVLVVGAFGFMVALADSRRLPRTFAPLMAVLAVLAAASDSVYVQAFQTRWQQSVIAAGDDDEGTVSGRILRQFTTPFALAAETPITGHGIGLGTMAGARLATGRTTFLLSESEWARIVQEMGGVLGFAFIGWRVWLALSLLRRSWRHFRETHDPLSWLLAGAAFLPVLNAQWGPSTHLGFAVFTAGLCLAALNVPDDNDETDDDTESEPDAAES